MYIFLAVGRRGGLMQTQPARPQLLGLGEGDIKDVAHQRVSELCLSRGLGLYVPISLKSLSSSIKYVFFSP